VGSFTRDFHRRIRRALETKGLTLCELCEGNLEGAPLLGTLKGMKRRLWRRASLSIGVPLGNLEGGSFTRDFKRYMKEGSGNGVSLSLWELYEGKVEGGLLYWGSRRICSVGLWKWASVSMADQFWGTWRTLLS
jgi:hypothetical protein